MEEQIKFDLSDVCDNDTVHDDEVEEDDEESIVYKKRLINLIKEISKMEDFEGIQKSKKGLLRLQVASKFLISMLIFDILDELKKKGKKTIMVKDVDEALDKILAKSSAIDIVRDMLNKDIDTLKTLSGSTSVNKATRFINR